jgi:hypothetical protein
MCIYNECKNRGIKENLIGEVWLCAYPKLELINTYPEKNKTKTKTEIKTNNTNRYVI